jgi:hypothetical protein
VEILGDQGLNWVSSSPRLIFNHMNSNSSAKQGQGKGISELQKEQLIFAINTKEDIEGKVVALKHLSKMYNDPIQGPMLNQYFMKQDEDI